MKKCKNCQAMYQGHSCDCGFQETKKKRYEPKDDWIFKRQQEINSWKMQIIRMNDYLQSANSEFMKRSIMNMISISQQKLREAELHCGQLLRDVLQTPEDLKCQGFDPGHGVCSKIGTSSHFGSDIWFCNKHYQR